MRIHCKNSLNSFAILYVWNSVLRKLCRCSFWFTLVYPPPRALCLCLTIIHFNRVYLGLRVCGCDKLRPGVVDVRLLDLNFVFLRSRLTVRFDVPFNAVQCCNFWHSSSKWKKSCWYLFVLVIVFVLLFVFSRLPIICTSIVRFTIK